MAKPSDSIRASNRRPRARALLLESGEGINFNTGGFAVAGVPAASAHPGRLIAVSNGASGSPCLAFSNGTNWLRITLGAAIAAS